MNKLKKSNPYKYLNGRQKIVFTFFLLLSIPLNLITAPSSGMEASWQIGLNMALHQDLVWGRDIVFTYGPLGFLQTRLSLYVTGLPIVLFSVSVWINVMFIFFYFLKECKLISLKDFLVAIVVVVMFYYVVKIEVSTTLLYIILFHLLYSLKHSTHLSVFVATITGSLAIFIKVTYFFPLIVIFGLYLATVISFNTGVNKQKVFLAYGFSILLISVLCFFLHIDFQQYVSASLHIVGAYNDAMMQIPSKESLLIWPLYLIIPVSKPVILSAAILIITFLITAPFLLMTVQSLWINRFHYLTTLTVLFCLFFLFLTFKYAFVRHGGLSYLYPPVLLYLLGLMACFSSVTKKMARYYTFFVCLVLFPPSVLLINRYVMLRETFTYYSLLLKAKSFLWKKPPDLNNSLNKHGAYIIPDSVKNKIGAQTVDIMPMEISLAYFNNLHYNPRPVIQSYAAYDSFLDTKNFNFYNSLQAPEFVIYATSTIDNRYHFYDEPKTKFNLLKHYYVVDSFHNQLLLQRRSVAKVSEIRKQQQQEMVLNREYEVPLTNAFQLSSFQISYTALGSAIRFLFQPPIIEISFYLENGVIYTHRVVKTSIEVPVLINKYLSNNNDFARLFVNNLDSIATIRKIKIIAPEWAYKASINVRHEWIVLKDSTLK